MRILIGILAVVLGAQLASAADVGPARDAFVATTDPLGEPVKKVVYLQQNWSPAESIQVLFHGTRVADHSVRLVSCARAARWNHPIPRQSEYSQVSLPSSKPR